MVVVIWRQMRDQIVKVVVTEKRSGYRLVFSILFIYVIDVHVWLVTALLMKTRCRDTITVARIPHCHHPY